jgi:hypothetical protein
LVLVVDAGAAGLPDSEAPAPVADPGGSPPGARNRGATSDTQAGAPPTRRPPDAGEAAPDGPDADADRPEEAAPPGSQDHLGDVEDLSVFDEAHLGEVVDVDNSAQARVLQAFPGAEEVI